MATYEERIIEILTEISSDLKIGVYACVLGLLFYIACKILKNCIYRV